MHKCSILCRCAINSTQVLVKIDYLLHTSIAISFIMQDYIKIKVKAVNVVKLV